MSSGSSDSQSPIDPVKLSPLQQLLHTLPQSGSVEWIGLRPARRAPVTSVNSVAISTESGLEGDHYHGTRGKARQVTLIQAEHLAAVGSMLGRDAIDPALVRRNIVVRGINLLALKGRTIRLGEVVLQVTGICAPCSLMEELLGPGGYNAMRGHGGITARVVTDGLLKVGDEVAVVPSQELVEEDQAD
ncbi:MAG: MOSC domain-containing protein [Pirellulaceae bacterium]|nr:MOSC domain-containing protein [Planctomycetales bacterium]